MKSGKMFIYKCLWKYIDVQKIKYMFQSGILKKFLTTHFRVT